MIGLSAILVLTLVYYRHHHFLEVWAVFCDNVHITFDNIHYKK